MLVLRAKGNDDEITPFLLLALFSLRIVQDQYNYLALMQTNREHLGDGWREVMLPMPDTKERRRQVADPVRAYVESTVKAWNASQDLLEIFDSHDLGTRP